MNKITIITATHNDVNYMDLLINSILQQTNKNFEWIIVDDGSTIANKKKLNTLTQSIPNLKVSYQSASGVSRARNAGYALTTTEWIIFVDADDSIDIQLIDEFYNSIVDNKYKLLISDFHASKDNGAQIIKYNVNYNNPKFSLGCLGNKVFKKTLLKDLFNANYKIGEDLDVFIQYVNKIDNHFIGRINSTFLYRIRNKSTIRKLSSGRYLDILTMAQQWEGTYDLSLKDNKYLISAINEHAYIYTYIRLHMDPNYRQMKKKVHKLWNKISVKKIMITKRTFSLFILSIIFKCHIQILLLPLIYIYKKRHPIL